MVSSVHMGESSLHTSSKRAVKKIIKLMMKDRKADVEVELVIEITL